MVRHPIYGKTNMCGCIFRFFLTDFMAARDLITAMISNNHMFRPNALEVMYHCLFWPPDKQLAFFQVNT